ncbi:MAG: DNA adenine methylase [Ignavibacteriaceae bacterium]
MISDPNNIDFKSFPTTRYQGSKRKILPWIYDTIRELRFHTVLDAFGGTGLASYLFKKMGKAVTYNDKLKFNFIIGKAIIENQDITISQEDVHNLFHHIKQNKSASFIQDTFNGYYYLPEENSWLDGMISGILNMNHYPSHILEYKKALVYYSLFQSAIIKRPFNLFHRKNLSIRTKDVYRSFGNKGTWDRSFQEYFQFFINEVNTVIFNSNVECKAINKSVFDIEEDNFDLVYLDPPYSTKGKRNESSDYLKCYHFLEGIANYTDWSNLIDYNSVNLRFKNDDENNDFNCSTLIMSFEEIIKKYKNSILVLSYKKGGIPSINTIIRIMKKYKRNVSTRSLHYKYALNRQNGDAKRNREVLIIGT